MRAKQRLLVVAAAVAVQLGGVSGTWADPPPPDTETTTTAYSPPATKIPGGVAGAAVTKIRRVRGLGWIDAAFFSIDLRKGPNGKVVYGRFHSLELTSIRFRPKAATLRGFGTVGGERVRFTAVAVDNGAHGDRFRIAWSRGAAQGGIVVRGGIVIR